MKYKKIKYNIIIVSLIMITACVAVIPLSTTFSLNTPENEIFLESSKNDLITNEEIKKDVDDEHYEKDKFLNTNAWDLVNYSLDMLYTGKGFSSVHDQTLSILADIKGIKASGAQNVKGYIKRNGQESLEERYLYSNYGGFGSNLIKNGYEYFYVNKQQNTFKVGKTEISNHKNRTYDLNGGNTQTYSYEDGFDIFFVLYGDHFPIENNYQTIFSTNEGEVEQDDIFGKCRNIELVYDINKIPSSMKKFYESSGLMSDVEYTKLNISFKINVNTGKMVSISRDEVTIGTNKAFGAKVTLTMITTQLFLQVDEPQQINVPK